MPDPVLDPAVLARQREAGGDELVDQLLAYFRRTTPERLARIQDGLARGDAHQCEQAAHAMLSTAGNVGAAQVRALAYEVERMAEAGRLTEMPPWVAALADACRQALTAADEAAR